MIMESITHLKQNAIFFVILSDLLIVSLYRALV